MVRAPIHTCRWATVCLIATLVLGAFSFAVPTHASTTSMPQMESMEEIPAPAAALTDCFQQGCVQVHATCDQHCVRPADESPTSADATITSQNDQQDVSDPVRTRLTDFPDNPSVFLPVLDRAPPIHQFLRSVIKRE